MKQEAKKEIAKLNLAKLRKDLQTVMDEIDATSAEVPDAYSPHMWMRLQNTTNKVATAINAVRLRLAGKTCVEIAAELGISKFQVAAYVAWNTMLQPSWMRPAAKQKLRKSAEPHCMSQDTIPQESRSEQWN